MKVMLVDDNNVDLRGIHDFVPWDTLECEVCAMERDGAAGLKSAKKHKPELIITDISMPLMDGIEMCKKIREFMPNVYIIFLTCLEEFDYAQEVIKMGLCDYITKPVDIDQLIECISKIKNIHSKKVEKKMKMLEMERIVKENKPYMEKSVLKDIILGVNIQKSLIKRYISGMNIDDKRSYTEICFEMQIVGRSIIYETRKLFDLIDKKLIQVYGGWNVEMRIGVNVAVIPRSDNFDNLMNSLSDIQQSFFSDCDAELKICVGKEHTAFSELHHEYERISMVLNDYIFYESNIIVCADELCTEHTQPFEQIDLSEMTKDMTSIMVLDDDDDLIGYFVDKYLPKNKSKNMLNYIGYVVMNIGMSLERLNSNLPQLGMWDIWKCTNECKTYTEIRSSLISILKKAKSLLKSKIKNSTQSISDMVTNIIDNEYSNIETLEDIADRFGLTTIYINRIFKKDKELTIYEYLVKTRIDKAKELLGASQLTATEVGHMVGYKTARYFNFVFKQKTGVTPGQYRKLLEQEKDE